MLLLLLSSHFNVINVNDKNQYTLVLDENDDG